MVFLAEPTTHSQNLFVVGLVEDAGAGEVWIGGSDLVHEGRWLWMNSDQNINSGYTNWEPGQPDNWKEGHCMRLWADHAHHWDDFNCSEKYPFVCQSPLSDAVVVG